MSEAYIYAPETIIKAYSLGVFPMAESRDDGALHFYEPQQRGILPINPP
ncbi:MAG: leucyl/phenylalanyl-tRNA--protein transferase, partial [Candidatus Puniceispirillaceae bacterium]